MANTTCCLDRSTSRKLNGMNPIDSSTPVSVPKRNDQLADSTREPTGHHEFPEGGTGALGVACGTSLAAFCTLGYVTSFGMFQTCYVQNQLSDQSPSPGPLFGRHGAKILFPAGVIYVAPVMLTSISSQYWHYILAQVILRGFSGGVVLDPPRYFFQKRGAAMGLAVAGSSIGGVIFPLALPRLS
ncbi:major facilitator superfamily domain-containing protein [Xylaria digitata]|nr:major facilitator superfamily domain-containing protein [Xylaria digitata]